MSDMQIGVLSCSGEECLGGTLARMATRKVMEQDPENIVTLCLPLYIAGGEEERSFAKDYPVISVDGCRECCAKRATIKFSGDVQDTIVLSDILGDDVVHEKIMSIRDLTDEHYQMADQVAQAISEKVKPLLDYSN